MPDDEPKPEHLLSSRKTRNKVVVVGQTRLRFLEQSSYHRLLNRTSRLGPWKREQFANKNVHCAACHWQPPAFLAKGYVRTFLTVHHMISSADGGSDDPDNLIILCPNCHSPPDYLPSIIVLPVGEEKRPALISHLQLLNNHPEEWKRQYDAWNRRQKRNAVDSLRDPGSSYDGSLETFFLE